MAYMFELTLLSAGNEPVQRRIIYECMMYNDPDYILTRHNNLYPDYRRSILKQYYE